MSALVSAKGLTRWYGEVIAVTDLSLDLDAGIVGLVGPNGAGKSTLMKLLVGQLQPSRGQAFILGRNVWDDRAALRHVGYCPEHERAYDELTGLEFCTALTELHGFAHHEAKIRARNMLERFDLTDAMNRRIGEYSKGMRQRCKLAQALAHDPEVLLLDEPLTGCDPLARVRVMEVLREAAARGRCIVLSSHVLHEIESLTSRIVLMHKGRVLAQGNIEEIRALIDRHPHKVRIGCSAPRKLAEVLIALPHVVQVSIEEAAIEVETRTPDALYSAVPQAARSARVSIQSLTSPDNNIAAVFHYLTKDERLSAEQVLKAGAT